MSDAIKHPPVPFALVQWDDAWKSAVTDTTLETAGDDHKPVPCLSHGWVIRDDEKGVQLANEYSPNGTYRHLAFIPRAMVVSVKPVKWTKVRQPKPKQEASELRDKG